MSAWAGKYVIGLTGNIATGKSVVRKMLEHLGAYGIDADALSHRVISKDAPGFQAVIQAFGKWVIGSDGQIDRGKLARVVFTDPEALKQLEEIIHPHVRQAIDILVRRSKQKVVVIEAIKLLESPIHQGCDSTWVTYASPESQLSRLIKKRGMKEDAARQRVAAQSPQQIKLAAASVIIHNESTFEDTWKQVLAAWPKQVEPAEKDITEPEKPASGALTVERARPRRASDIAALISRLTGGAKHLTSEDIMEAFGEKAFMLLVRNQQLVGLVGWQVENLVARTDDIYLESSLPLKTALQSLMQEVESASKDLQCEASLLFVSPQLAHQESVWRELGYEPRTVHSLGVRAWQEAAQETISGGEVLFFKQLRQDRVLRPV
jgi:dephospho-CoA kinase